MIAVHTDAATILPPTRSYDKIVEIAGHDEEALMKNESIPNVISAFELVLEEVEDEIEYVNQQGSRAFAAGNYEQVDAARKQADRLTDYRKKIAMLDHVSRTLATSFKLDEDEDEQTQIARRDLGRLKRGVRTPEEAFRLPILQALVELGGSAKLRDVLEKVEASMKGQLSEADYQPLPSTPGTSRWYNTGQWSRNTMVNEGLLGSDSPRGTWEITATGREYLKKHS